MRIGFADFCGWDFHAQSVDRQPMGGSQSAACYVAQALARRGHDVFLFSHTSTPGTFGGVKCLSWLSTPLFTLRPLKFDVLVCLLGTDNGAMLRSAAGPATRLVLWTQHSFDQPIVQQLHRSGDWKFFDDIVLVSDWQREEFLRRFGLDPKRTHVLRNAVAPIFENQFPDDLPILPQKDLPPVLAYTSTPFRGLDLLLEVFPAIRAAVPDARLRVYSSMNVYQVARDADQATYGGLYRRCRETAGVEYVGSLPQPALARALRGVLALAYPNTFAETSCISALEAMASGCTVVSSALGALPETTAGFGRLTPIGHDRQRYLAQFVEQTTEVLRAGVSHDAQTEELLRRQVSYIRANATWEVRAAQWEQWLKHRE